MKKILLTGATGFIGKNLYPLLCKKYDVSAPTRAELDLLDSVLVYKYLSAGKFDAVLHFATPTGQNPMDKQGELFERSMNVFLALERCSDLYGKMIYLGSGAEYGKHRSIELIREEQFGEELPRDSYGLSRYCMSKMAQRHDNIMNLRIFGCCGLFDPPHKLIPYIIDCIRQEKKVLLRQDVLFDFLYVEDIFPVLVYCIEHSMEYNAYNLCTGRQMLISAIANEVLRQTKSTIPVAFEKCGLGLEYTGSNERIHSEIPNWEPHSMNYMIQKILEGE